MSEAIIPKITVANNQRCTSSRRLLWVLESQNAAMTAKLIQAIAKEKSIAELPIGQAVTQDGLLQSEEDIAESFWKDRTNLGD